MRCLPTHLKTLYLLRQQHLVLPVLRILTLQLRNKLAAPPASLLSLQLGSELLVRVLQLLLRPFKLRFLCQTQRQQARNEHKGG